MTEFANYQDFADAYAGVARWDIDGPQVPFAAAAGKVKSPVLDAGCGTGEHALYFAAHGHRVTGIDFVDEAIQRARDKAAKRGLKVEFRTANALDLVSADEQFATVLDSGLFHVFSDENRRRYVAGLTHVLTHEGRLLLMCFSDEEPGTQGPRRVSRQELETAFADGWEIESIEPRRFAVTPVADEVYSEGGPKAWFAVIRRSRGALKSVDQSE